MIIFLKGSNCRIIRGLFCLVTVLLYCNFVYVLCSGQKEKHFTNGVKEIHFTDGSVRTIYANGEEETQLPDGVRVKLRAGDSSSAAASSIETATGTGGADRSANTSEPLNTPRPSAAALLSPSQQLVERIYEFPDGQREVHTAEFKVPFWQFTSV